MLTKKLTHSEAGKLGALASKPYYEQNRLEKEKQYRLAPKHCKGCNSVLSYSDSQAKKVFCNRSCATTYNNLQRVKKLGVFQCVVCGKEKIKTRQTQNKYCSLQCQATLTKKTAVELWLSGVDSGIRKQSTAGFIKRYLLEQQNNKCAHCGITEHNGKPLVLELEHKDGDSDNNRPENLECLCPNCHSQTPTYKNRNKGKGRHARRIRYSLDKSF